MALRDASFHVGRGEAALLIGGSVGVFGHGLSPSEHNGVRHG